jgi:hypothetical protein
MNTQVREFENQKWVWNKQGLEVFDLVRKKRHQARWQEVVSIRGCFIKLQNGMSLLIKIPNAEKNALGAELREAFKEFNPCAWAAVTRKSLLGIRRACLISAPTLISLFMFIPWLVLYLMIITTGADADLPDLTEDCVKWMIIGVFCTLIFPSLYFIKLRTHELDVLAKVEKMELENGCRRLD